MNIRYSFALMLLLGLTCSGHSFFCHKCNSDYESCNEVDDTTPIVDCTLQGKETNCYQIQYIFPADSASHVERGCWPGVNYCELIEEMTEFIILHCNECKGDNCNSTPFTL